MSSASTDSSLYVDMQSRNSVPYYNETIYESVGDDTIDHNNEEDISRTLDGFGFASATTTSRTDCCFKSRVNKFFRNLFKRNRNRLEKQLSDTTITMTNSTLNPIYISPPTLLSRTVALPCTLAPVNRESMTTNNRDTSTMTAMRTSPLIPRIPRATLRRTTPMNCTYYFFYEIDKNIRLYFIFFFTDLPASRNVNARSRMDTAQRNLAFVIPQIPLLPMSPIPPPPPPPQQVQTRARLAMDAEQFDRLSNLRAIWLNDLRMSAQRHERLRATAEPQNNNHTINDSLLNHTRESLARVNRIIDSHQINVTSMYSRANTAPVYPHYERYDNRLRTYNCWPISFPIDKNLLTDAGFFYTERNDTVACYYCGNRLNEWSAGNDPWVCHALLIVNNNTDNSMVPKSVTCCAYVFLVKGSSFVDSVRYGTNNKNFVKYLTTNLNSIASVKTVISASTLLENAKDQQFVKTEMSLSDSTLSPQPASSTSSRSCLICCVEICSVLFYPCGHLVSCYKCAAGQTKCFVCRQKINDIVKVFSA